MSLFTFILLSNSVWRVGRSNLKIGKATVQYYIYTW